MIIHMDSIFIPNIGCNFRIDRKKNLNKKNIIKWWLIKSTLGLEVLWIMCYHLGVNFRYKILDKNPKNLECTPNYVNDYLTVSVVIKINRRHRS